MIEGYQLPMSFTHSTVHSMLARMAEKPEGGMVRPVVVRIDQLSPAQDY